MKNEKLRILCIPKPWRRWKECKMEYEPKRRVGCVFISSDNNVHYGKHSIVPLFHYSKRYRYR